MNSSGAVLYRREAADEKKNFQKFWWIVLSSRGCQSNRRRESQAAKPHFRRVEESPRRPFHHANLVINSGYDPRVCFAGRVSRYRHAGSGWGSITAQQI